MKKPSKRKAIRQQESDNAYRLHSSRARHAARYRSTYVRENWRDYRRPVQPSAGVGLGLALETAPTGTDPLWISIVNLVPTSDPESRP